MVALLSEAGFDSFQETEAGLRAYGETDRDREWRRELDAVAARFSFTYTAEKLPERNWNEEWESQFPPLYVGDRLFIRADFHAPDPDVELELVITPKMAFGTGHHATTYMMCELMFDLDFTGKRVLDYGSGTGVLAVLAKKLGGEDVDAVEVEGPAAENTLENAERNVVRLKQVVHGTLADLPAGPPYDVILANINRNVILATAAELYDRLTGEGRILFSGILAKDEALLLKELGEVGFEHLRTESREDWRAFVFAKD